MSKQEKHIALILIVMVLVILIIALIVSNISSKDKDRVSITTTPTPEVYQSNEYSDIIITDEQMCKNYLNDYLNILITDKQKAYSYLDEEYKNKYFPTFDSFVVYIMENVQTAATVSSYNVSNNVYTVIDSFGKTYKFNNLGVMYYTVQFGDKK